MENLYKHCLNEITYSVLPYMLLIARQDGITHIPSKKKKSEKNEASITFFI